ncbi:MAG: peptidoglycan-binding protein [Acidimicrobiia bacterium]|nr:peptidoglycan-binding protein [Acidimicrobiia bacterium]
MSIGRGRSVPAAAVLVAACVLAAACSDDPAVTTTAPTTTLPPTTTTTEGRVELAPNDEPFLRQGNTGSFVEALQFYLVCTGHGQLSPDGPMMTVDGQFGPMTSDAVAWYQAELRRMPTGDPDEGTFAQLARDCAEPRLVAFPERQGTTRVGGNAAPGDDEVIDLEGVPGRVLTIVVDQGEVQVGLEQADGTRVQQVGLGGGWSGKLPTGVEYRLRVTAAEASSYVLDLGVARPRYINIDFGRMRLASDGFGILTFDDDAERVISRLQSILGPPAEDTGWALGDAAERTCTGNNRHLTWILQPAETGTEHPAVLYVHFSDVDTGSQAFAEYAYVSLDPQAVDAGVMDLATAGGVSIGRTVAEFAEVYGQPVFTDGTSGLTLGGGMLFGITTEGEDDLVWFIGSGDDGCEGYD